MTDYTAQSFHRTEPTHSFTGVDSLPYDPSWPAALISACLFTLLTVFLLIRVANLRLQSFSPLILGGFCEVIGYIGRIFSAQQSQHLGLQACLIQDVLLLVAPCAMIAAIYTTLGRLIRQTDVKGIHFFEPCPLTVLFTLGESLAFTLQLIGALAPVIEPSSAGNVGTSVITVGLTVQVVFLSLYAACAVFLHYYLSQRKIISAKGKALGLDRELTLVYSATVLIIFRSTFRSTAYALGENNLLNQSEIFLYVFDALPMLLVIGLYVVWPPRQILMAHVQGSSALSCEDRYSYCTDGGAVLEYPCNSAVKIGDTEMSCISTTTELEVEKIKTSALITKR